MKRILTLSILATLTLFTASSCSMKENLLSVAELLDLGEKYLLEMEYEQATVQFLKVIEIEPMNPRGYTGAAEAYIGLSRTDEAESILRQGLDALPNNVEIQNRLDELGYEPAINIKSEPSTESEQNKSVELRELSADFLGELLIENLSYELRDGDPRGNAIEGFIGYTYINFNFVLSSISQEKAENIKGCAIGGWQETPFTEDEIIHNCRYLTGLWGDRDPTYAVAITSCGEQGFPTYEEDRGKQYQVCFVLMDGYGAAIGYSLVNVEIPLI